MRQPALPGLAPEDDEGALRRAYERVPGLKRTRTLEEALVRERRQQLMAGIAQA